jgi:Holliday junction resolvasome RuvABC endonuclease subunit
MSFVISTVYFIQSFTVTDYGVVSFSLDGLLVNHEKSQLMKEVGKVIYKIWKGEVKKEQQLTREEIKTVLYLALAEGNVHIMTLFSVA